MHRGHERGGQRGAAFIARRPRHPNQRVALTMIAIVVATAALHWAQAVVVPIALAILIAFVLAPLVAGLERRRVPSAVAVVLVVTLTVSTLGGLSWALFSRFDAGAPRLGLALKS